MLNGEKKTKLSLQHLPPINEIWHHEDMEGLTRKELESLLVLLKNKMDLVTDCYEYELFYSDRRRYIQMKDSAYKYKDKIRERV